MPKSFIDNYLRSQSLMLYIFSSLRINISLLPPPFSPVSFLPCREVRCEMIVSCSWFPSGDIFWWYIHFCVCFCDYLQTMQYQPTLSVRSRPLWKMSAMRKRATDWLSRLSGEAVPTMSLSWSWTLPRGPLPMTVPRGKRNSRRTRDKEAANVKP